LLIDDDDADNNNNNKFKSYVPNKRRKKVLKI